MSINQEEPGKQALVLLILIDCSVDSSYIFIWVQRFFMSKVIFIKTKNHMLLKAIPMFANTGIKLDNLSAFIAVNMPK